MPFLVGFKNSSYPFAPLKPIKHASCSCSSWHCLGVVTSGTSMRKRDDLLAAPP